MVSKIHTMTLSKPGKCKYSKDENNFCDFPLSLTTGEITATVATESSFWMRWLKNKMRYNVDNGK